MRGQVLTVPNEGQWTHPALAVTPLAHGALFWDELGYRAVLWNGDHHHGGPHALPTSGWSVFRSHLGTAGSPLLEPVRTTDAPRHYFLGNDARRWRSNVAEWTAFLHKDLYPGIDAWIRDSTGDLAVDYRIAPGVDPSVIRWHYPGASRIELDADGNARIETPAGILWETAPRAYQQTPDGEREVRVRFRLTETESGTALSFDLGKYDKKMPLVVDPKLVFASFSGSTSDNWGFTATYDDQGNLYGGGIVFSPGYPTTPGAFDPTYSQGLNTTTDVGITKFSSNGSQRLFSTYLGGNNSDQPHSMIVANNELIVFGITSSTNFPITINAAQSNFVGGDLRIQVQSIHLQMALTYLLLD